MQSNHSNTGSTLPNNTLRISAVILAIVAIGLVILGVTTRAQQYANLKAQADKQAVPTVSVGLAHCQ